MQGSDLGSLLSRRRMLQGIGLAGGGLAAVGLIGCGSGTSSSSPTKDGTGAASSSGKSGSLIGSFSSGQTLSPNSTALWATEYYALYDQLARLEPGGKLEPGLA